MNDSKVDMRIVTMRTEDDSRGVPGSLKDTCVECGKEVWVSPSSQAERSEALSKHETVEVLCVPCLVTHHMNDVRGDIRIARGAVKELVMALRAEHEEN